MSPDRDSGTVLDTYLPWRRAARQGVLGISQVRKLRHGEARRWSAGVVWGRTWAVWPHPPRGLLLTVAVAISHLPGNYLSFWGTCPFVKKQGQESPV